MDRVSEYARGFLRFFSASPSKEAIERVGKGTFAARNLTSEREPLERAIIDRGSGVVIHTPKVYPIMGYVIGVNPVHGVNDSQIQIPPTGARDRNIGWGSFGIRGVVSEHGSALDPVSGVASQGETDDRAVSDPDLTDGGDSKLHSKVTPHGVEGERKG